MSDGLSVKERIALLKQKNSSSNEGHTTSTPEKVERKLSKTLNSDEMGASESTTKRRSIADRIAAMKANSEATSPSPPGAAVAGKSTGGSINDVTATIQPSPASSNTPRSEQAPSTGVGSIADKIAALKSTPTSSDDPSKPKQTPPTERKLSIADKIAALKASSTGGGESSKVDQTPPPRKTSIADKIAALKAETPGNGEESTPKATQASGRRLSSERANFAAKLNLAGFNPTAPRPSFTSPPRENSETETPDKGDNVCSRRSSITESGDMKHLSLSRPSVPSMRRKRGAASVRLSTEELSGDVQELLNSTEQDKLNSVSEAAATPETLSRPEALDKDVESFHTTMKGVSSTKESTTCELEVKPDNLSSTSPTVDEQKLDVETVTKALGATTVTTEPTPDA